MIILNLAILCCSKFASWNIINLSFSKCLGNWRRVSESLDLLKQNWLDAHRIKFNVSANF